MLLALLGTWMTVGKVYASEIKENSGLLAQRWPPPDAYPARPKGPQPDPPPRLGQDDRGRPPGPWPHRPGMPPPPPPGRGSPDRRPPEPPPRLGQDGWRRPPGPLPQTPGMPPPNLGWGFPGSPASEPRQDGRRNAVASETEQPVQKHIPPAVIPSGETPDQRRDSEQTSMTHPKPNPSPQPETMADLTRRFSSSPIFIATGLATGCAATIVYLYIMICKRKNRQEETLREEAAQTSSHNFQDRVKMDHEEQIRKNLEDQSNAYLQREAARRQRQKHNEFLNESWQRAQRKRQEKKERTETHNHEQKDNNQQKASRTADHRDISHDKKWACSILGVNLRASPREIKRSYIKMIKKTHPDKASSINKATEAEFLEKAKLINVAYDIMKK